LRLEGATTKRLGKIEITQIERLQQQRKNRKKKKEVTRIERHKKLAGLMWEKRTPF